MMASVLKKLYDGIVLISVGVILLLNVTGYVGWAIWLFYLNFWPLLLILAGFRLVLSIKKGLEVFVYIFQIILWLAVIFGGLYYYKSTNENGFYSASLNYDYTLETDNTINGKSVNYTLDLAFGDFNLVDTDNSNYLIHAKGTRSMSMPEPNIYTEKDGNDINVFYDQNKNTVFFLPFSNVSNDFDLTLGQSKIENVKINLGAGKLTSEFENTSIAEVELSLGAGEANFTLTDNAEVGLFKVSVGAGKSTLTLDSSVGYIITYNVGAGSLVLDGKQIGGLGSRGVDVKSDNYNQAITKINLNVDVGAGEFALTYVSK